MSRYFDILKEASRWQSLPKAPPPASPAESGAPGDGNGLLSEIPEQTLRNGSTPFPVPDPVMDAGPFEGVAPVAGDAGTAVRAVPDPKEVLLPNATDEVVVETYRRLRTKIQQQHAAKPIRSLLVASPGSGDGKTITVLNLAWSFGMLPSFKVLVLDGDLRKASVNDALGVGRRPGLSDVVEGSAPLDDVILYAEGVPFHFMQSGTSRIPAPELLTSPRLRSAIQQATERYDLVLVDSPPVNLMSDAQALAGGCDAVLMVARAFSTTTRAFEKALYDLAPFRIIGTVLNGGTRPERRSYYYRKYTRANG